MRVISLINLKGGVAKTTTAVNMATILAERYGKKVLVIDADPQANATQFFGLKNKGCNSLPDVMDGTCTDLNDFVYETRTPGVSIVPSRIDLIQYDMAQLLNADHRKLQVIKGICDNIRDDNEFYECEGCNADRIIDYVIIDCPPCFSASSVSAIYASDDVIIPVKIDAYALDGMAELMEQIASIQGLQPGIRIAGVLVTMWHNSPAVVQGEELLRKTGLPVFKQHIRMSDMVDESTFALQSLETYSPRSAAGVDYRRFVAEYFIQEVR